MDAASCCVRVVLSAQRVRGAQAHAFQRLLEVTPKSQRIPQLNQSPEGFLHCRVRRYRAGFLPSVPRIPPVGESTDAREYFAAEYPQSRTIWRIRACASECRMTSRMPGKCSPIGFSLRNLRQALCDSKNSSCNAFTSGFASQARRTSSRTRKKMPSPRTSEAGSQVGSPAAMRSFDRLRLLLPRQSRSSTRSA